ncbi:hypothetical protein [Rhodopseudomonas palustris]|uniref:hypothetical protein n=1 Tax=Rhodopseudomonas palustris TaxID=1076 RepID=UPI001F2453D9|nr:hypothetical protein [Rhodopseudomonas palustris]
MQPALLSLGVIAGSARLLGAVQVRSCQVVPSAPPARPAAGADPTRRRYTFGKGDAVALRDAQQSAEFGTVLVVVEQPSNVAMILNAVVQPQDRQPPS